MPDMIMGRGEVGRGDPAAAEAVERDAAGLDVVAGVERRHPAHVAALQADLRRAAPDDVVDLGGVEIVAVLERLEHRRRRDAAGCMCDSAPLPTLPMLRGVRTASMM